MLIEYERESVREIFNDLDLMRKKIGNEMTRTIKKRLDQLRQQKFLLQRQPLEFFRAIN